MPDEELLVCPYCDREQYCHEPDEISALMCPTEYEHCGKTFWYRVDVLRTYDSTPYDDDAATQAGEVKQI